MSKKLFFVIVTVVCTACFSRGNYTVTGTVDSSYNGKTIYLESLGDTRERIIDSTVVDGSHAQPAGDWSGTQQPSWCSQRDARYAETESQCPAAAKMR